MPTALEYHVVIERGYTAVNDRIIDTIKPHVRAPYLDIGCNVGWLLSEVPGGTGVDAAHHMLVRARAKGRDVVQAWGERLPFADGRFDTAVCCCVLEQCEQPMDVIHEARRVARRVIGIAPLPGSTWGVVGASCGWVKGVIPPADLVAMGARIAPVDSQRYFFEIS